MTNLSQIAREEGVSRQAVWSRTEKGKDYLHSNKRKSYMRAYMNKYRKTDKNKAYMKAYFLRKKSI